jgi:two-component system, response regulator
MSLERFVLYVEDNPDDVDLTLISFKERRFPHPVKVASDGAEALDFLFGEGKYAGRDKRDTPALVLLDLNLPKVGGLDVLKRIRADKSLRSLVVVILTSSSEERDRVDAEAYGANLYLQKPVSYNDFGKVAAEIESMLSLSGPGTTVTFNSGGRGGI